MKSRDPLRLTCTKTDCAHGLHAFRPDKKMITAGKEGECLACHEKFFDFSQSRQRNLADIDNTFTHMKMEYVRHWFWTTKLNEKARERATGRGLEATKAEMEKRLRSSIAPAKPFRDGFQTPIDDPKNIIYWAQHATACCCRRCVEYWHGIERGHELTEEEVEYLLALAMRFIQQRLPELNGGSGS